MECALTQVVVTHVDVWKAMKGRESSVQVSYLASSAGLSFMEGLLLAKITDAASLWASVDVSMAGL